MILPRTSNSSLMGSGSSLTRDWQAAHATMLVLEQQLRECRPHARDYSDYGEYSEARVQHFRQEAHLDTLTEYARIMLAHLDR